MNRRQKHPRIALRYTSVAIGVMKQIPKRLERLGVTMCGRYSLFKLEMPLKRSPFVEDLEELKPRF